MHLDRRISQWRQIRFRILDDESRAVERTNLRCCLAVPWNRRSCTQSDLPDECYWSDEGLRHALAASSNRTGRQNSLKVRTPPKRRTVKRKTASGRFLPLKGCFRVRIRGRCPGEREADIRECGSSARNGPFGSAPNFAPGSAACSVVRVA